VRSWRPYSNGNRQTRGGPGEVAPPPQLLLLWAGRAARSSLVLARPPVLRWQFSLFWWLHGLFCAWAVLRQHRYIAALLTHSSAPALHFSGRHFTVQWHGPFCAWAVLRQHRYIAALLTHSSSPALQFSGDNFHCSVHMDRSVHGPSWDSPLYSCTVYLLVRARPPVLRWHFTVQWHGPFCAWTIK
jgi:hypothetical protein